MGSFTPVSYFPWLSSNCCLIQIAPIVFELPPFLSRLSLSHPTCLTLLPPPATAHLVPPHSHLAPASPYHLVVHHLVILPFCLLLISPLLLHLILPLCLLLVSPLHLLLVLPLCLLLISHHPSSSSLSSSFSPSLLFSPVFVVMLHLICITLHLVTPHHHSFRVSCPPPHLFCLHCCCVVPPLCHHCHCLAPHLALPPSCPCFSSSSLFHPLDSPVINIIVSALVTVCVSLDSPLSVTNPPISLWKGEGWIGLQPRL